MKKILAEKGNFKRSFINKESAKQFIKENPDYILVETNEWEFYNANSLNVYNRYERLNGDTLIEAIENDFERITKVTGLYGASGYFLKNVVLVDNNDSTATLTIKGYPFSKALVGFDESKLNDVNLKTIMLKIEGVESGDVPDGEYAFDIIKSN